MLKESLKASALLVIAFYAPFCLIGEYCNGWNGAVIRSMFHWFFSFWNLIVWLILFLIVLAEKQGKKERDRKEEEELKQVREEGIAQARAEAAKQHNFRHDPLSGSYLICPVCLGGGKNAGGYICPRCNGTGRA